MSLGTVRTTVERDRDTAISDAVITALAQGLDRDPVDIGPLYTWIDPDALDAVFDSPVGGGERSGGQIAFEAAGLQVEVVVDPDTVTVFVATLEV
ncbi:HalOD1 output domain-containing protein [Halobaculum marinum]|uniref:HalOD1 output domain-containing protein n=1 Tax=Halobaculum marinum TaxID=3031996 RepID=A0ABD5X2Z7_9EURY|nr:HalOD1 output domain-containing protein [Halobaculum sp. DT55]